MKHLATIDITKSGDKLEVMLHLNKKCRTFKVNSLKEALQKCEALISEYKNGILESQNPHKDNK